jgi:hypothetical protein
MSWNVTACETAFGGFVLRVNVHGPSGTMWYPTITWFADGEIACSGWIEPSAIREQAKLNAERQAVRLSEHSEALLTLLRFFRACAGGDGFVAGKRVRGPRTPVQLAPCTRSCCAVSA